MTVWLSRLAMRTVRTPDITPSLYISGVVDGLSTAIP